MKEKTWNVITVSLLLFVALFFVFGVVRDAVAEDDNVIVEEDVILQEDFELMILACATAYSVLTSDTVLEFYHDKAYQWREFYVGWNDNDEAQTDMYIGMSREIMETMMDKGEITGKEVLEAADMCDAFEAAILEWFAGDDAPTTFKEYNNE